MVQVRLLQLLTTATLAAVLAVGPVQAGGGGDEDERPPQDYTAVEGLSEPTYDTYVSHDRVALRDGVELAVDIFRPVDDGRWPTIVELSPYLGSFDEVVGFAFLGPDEQGQPVELEDYFPPRGYAVVRAAWRGTGRSSGCLDLLGANDRTDAHELVEWVADQAWSNGRVGMAGHSMPAYAAIAAASTAPASLVTIVASAGGARMYPHQFQQGVPYNDLVLGPLAVYQGLATGDYGRYATDKRPLDAGCEWFSSTAINTDHATGVETDWHRARDYRAAAAAAGIPVFATYGTDDAAVNLQSMDWFTSRGGRAGDKLWVGQWGHGHVSVGGPSYPYPNDREEQWRAAVHAWFDHHLQQRDVPTGPATEVFLNDGRVLVASSWPVATETLRLYPRGTTGSTRALGTEPGAAEVASFYAQPDGLTGSAVQLSFETAPTEEPLLLLGTPVLRLRAALDGGRVDLVARLLDVAPNGVARPLHHRGFAINPELRDGVQQVTPVVVGEVMDLEMVGVGVAHRIAPGHRLRLVVTSTGAMSGAARGYLPRPRPDIRVDVHLGGSEPTSLELPVATPEPRLWEDPRSS